MGFTQAFSFSFLSKLDNTLLSKLASLTPIIIFLSPLWSISYDKSSVFLVYPLSCLYLVQSSSFPNNLLLDKVSSKFGEAMSRSFLMSSLNCSLLATFPSLFFVLSLLTTRLTLLQIQYPWTLRISIMIVPVLFFVKNGLPHLLLKSSTWYTVPDIPHPLFRHVSRVGSQYLL